MSNPIAIEPNLETRADLGLTLQIFEPFHNLSAESRANLSSESPSPYYHRGPVRLYQGDALELLARAKSSTFDLIFADPPYFLSSGGITCQNGQMVSVNKGDWDKSVTPEEIHAFNLRWLRECQRLLKPDGTIWISGTSHNIYSVGFALQSLGYKVLNDIAWQKTNPPPHLACRYFTHAHETLLWARKSPKAKHYFDYPAMKADNGDKQMQSVWKLPAPSKWEKRFGKHPTQKPEILLDRIIRASSKPNDLILDPFCGSATTGVVAARLKRRFVGFEIESEFLDLAEERLNDEPQVEKYLQISFSGMITREFALQKLLSLKGKCLVELAKEQGQAIFHESLVNGELKRTINKGWAGLTLKRYLELPVRTCRKPNESIWELRQVSLKILKSGAIVPKETMQITMFDKSHTIEHSFETSHLLHKIQKLVIVARLYESAFETQSKVIAVRPADISLNEAYIYEAVRRDYEEIRAALIEGHSVKGNIGNLIQCRTKGSGHGSTSVAWYAKTRFVSLFLGIGK